VKRDRHQKIVYGLRRMTLAANRATRALTIDELIRANRWDLAWAIVAKVSRRVA